MYTPERDQRGHFCCTFFLLGWILLLLFQPRGSIPLHKQPEALIFCVGISREVLRLQDLLHDVVRVHPRGVKPLQLVLHRVLASVPVGGLRGPRWLHALLVDAVWHAADARGRAAVAGCVASVCEVA